MRKSIDVDLALLERYDARITDLELTIVREAKRHDGDAFHRLRSVPGIGKVLALTIDGTSEPAPPLTRPSFSG